MDIVLYDALPMPIAVCNIIESYAKIQITQIYNKQTDTMHYFYGDALLPRVPQHVTMGKTPNDTYVFLVTDDYKISIYYNFSTKNTYASLDKPIRSIKYHNYLICDHVDSIAIYDVHVINNTVYIKTLHHTNANSMTLYANDDYIIALSNNSNELIIYTNTLIYLYKMQIFSINKLIDTEQAVRQYQDIEGNTNYSITLI